MSEGRTTREAGVVQCDACPVLCRIRPGRTGACDRYANADGRLFRLDPLVVTEAVGAGGGPLVPLLARGRDWDGNPVASSRQLVTGVGAGTTYPDYKPAPFIVAGRHEGVDTVTVVTEAMFDYCGVKVKIDTERDIGPERAAVRYRGEEIGHVTTAEYNSQMLSLGGVRHLTEGGKRKGAIVLEALLALLNRRPIELEVEDGARLVVQAGMAPVIDGEVDGRMPVGSGSAAIGMFAQQIHGHVDEAIVVDEHSTGVLTEHQAGAFLGMPPSGIRVRGLRSPTGRYLNAVGPGRGWGGTDLDQPPDLITRIDAKVAWPGLRLFMVSTTGEDAVYYVLDEGLRPVPAEMPAPLAEVARRITDSCEPALVSVLFMAGAGGSLRAGAVEHPIRLTRSIKDGGTRVTCGGADVYVWPGGGITIMVDVAILPENAFGSVPLPAVVAPIEFTMRAEVYAALGGHTDRIVGIGEVLEREHLEVVPARKAHTAGGGEDGR